MRHCVSPAVKMLLVTAVTAAVAEGTLVPNLDLQALVDNSDAIVLGQVVRISQEGRTWVQLGGGVVAAESVSGTMMRAETGDRKDAEGSAGRSAHHVSILPSGRPRRLRRITQRTVRSVFPASIPSRLRDSGPVPSLCRGRPWGPASRGRAHGSGDRRDSVRPSVPDRLQ